MAQHKYKMFIFIAFMSQLNVGFCSELNISEKTKKLVVSIFGDIPTVYDENIVFRINSFKSGGNLLVEGDLIIFRVLFRKKNELPDLIGIFLDGNRNPLIATIKPRNSTKNIDKNVVSSGISYEITDFADNYCGGKYNAVIVLKINNKLIARSISFSTIVADCGLNNGQITIK